MEFLNNTKNFGLMILILGVLDVVLAVLTMIDDGFSVIGLGSILGPIVMILAGLAIFSQTNGGIISFAFPEGSSSKFGALTGYIFATGLSAIVSLQIGGVIFGLLILLVGWIITNDKKTIIDSIIWIFLVVLFGLITLFAILGAFGGGIYLIVGGICTALLHLMGFLYLLDKDVKKKLV